MVFRFFLQITSQNLSFCFCIFDNANRFLLRLIYFFFGALDILLAFRLVLKVAGASTNSAFVAGIYGLSGIFTWPFEGIFRRGFTQGIETTSVLEPSTIVAILVYAILAWGIVKLIRISSGEQQPAE